MAALCKQNYDASVTQAKEYNSNVYLNLSIFQAVMKLHLNERELFVIQALGNNRLRVNSSRSAGECGGEIKARRHCLSLDPDAALLCLHIYNVEISLIHCPLSPTAQMRRESKHFSPISRLHFACFLALPLHPSSLKLFHFTNICWQRGIPNLSRAFFQISLLRLNADLSYCRCCRVFITFFSFFTLF